MRRRAVRRAARAVNALELTIVLAILGLVAAIAIPNLTQARPRNPEDELREQLRTLRSAIELYFRDHGEYPGWNPAGVDAPAGSEAALIAQLTRRTDASGQALEADDARVGFGPYVGGLPGCPVAGGCARVVVVLDEALPRARPELQAGWIYNARTGALCANSAQTDRDGLRYDRY